VLAIVIAVTLTRSVTKPVQAVVTQLGDVAHGDVSKDVPQEILGRRD